MQTEQKEFPLHWVLTITTGGQFCDNTALFTIFNHVARDQLKGLMSLVEKVDSMGVTVGDVLTEFVRKEHSDLPQWVPHDLVGNEDAIRQWVARLEKRHGKTRAIGQVTDNFVIRDSDEILFEKRAQQAAFIREFPLRYLLTVTTGVDLIGKNMIRGLFEISNHVANGELRNLADLSHVIDAADGLTVGDVIKAFVISKFPDLPTSVPSKAWRGAGIDAWVAKQEVKFGNKFLLERMPDNFSFNYARHILAQAKARPTTFTQAYLAPPVRRLMGAVRSVLPANRRKARLG